MAQVINIAKGINKYVKNLGWLDKHKSYVESLFFFRFKDSNYYEGFLIAHLGNKVYITKFASQEDCQMWCERNISWIQLEIL